VAALTEIGRIADSAGAHVLVDEVYQDAGTPGAMPAAARGGVFITTNSLTKSYGLAALRCGWTISSPALAERFRRTRDVVDGTGSIVSERLAVLAFSRRDWLRARATRAARYECGLCASFSPEPSRNGLIRRRNRLPRVRGVEDDASATGCATTGRDVPGRLFRSAGHFRLGFGSDRCAEGWTIAEVAGV
jgi:hypothetical protein